MKSFEEPHFTDGEAASTDHVPHEPAPMPTHAELYGPDGLNRLHEWNMTETARRQALGLDVVTGEPLAGGPNG